MHNAFDGIIEKIKNDEVWFCPQLFRHVYTHVDGYYAPCCVASNLPYHSSKVGIMDHMNSDIMSEIRYAMMTSKDDPIFNRYCSACKKSEKDYGHSERTRKLKQFEDNLETLLENVEGGTIKFYGRNIDFQLRTFGNQCNLDCLMCIPFNSSTRIRQDKQFDHLKMLSFNDHHLRYKDKNDYSKLEDEVLELVEHIDTWQVQGGEPFVMKKHYELLDRIIATGHAKNICLEFFTNGTVLKSGNHRMIDYIKQFNRVSCTISIDGYGINNEYIRRRSNWDQIVENINELRKLKNVEVKVFSTLNLLSVINFHLLREWCEEMNLPLESHILYSPKELHCRNLPEIVKKIVAERNPNEEALLKALELPRSKQQFDKALSYCHNVDRQYNNALELFDIFPELGIV